MEGNSGYSLWESKDDGDSSDNSDLSNYDDDDDNDYVDEMIVTATLTSDQKPILSAL